MGKMSIVSLGCPKNLVDSDNLLSGLKDEGIIYTPELEDADIVLVNTCGFIEDAKKESVEEILKLRQIKKKGKKLLVFGCLAKRYKEELIREIPEIDGIWGVGEEDKIIEYCRGLKGSGVKGQGSKKGGQRVRDEKEPVPRHLTLASSSSYAYLKIAEGCDRGCTFCVIPSIRGSFKSISPDKVLKKAEEYINEGIKELILVAQDIGSYGIEFKGYNLASLLRDISSISGDFWIRLLYLYPASIKDDLLSVISEEEKICKYLDIPLQHSEDKILKAMGRGGSKRMYMNLVKKIREAIPGIAIRTTFIVGFPGETEDDFNGLIEFTENMRFERLGVFKYSREEGTPAFRMKMSVPEKIRSKRRDEVMKIQSYISLEKNKSLIGRRFRVVVDDTDDNIAIARLYSQSPEIDGVVIIEKSQGAAVSEVRDQGSNNNTRRSLLDTRCSLPLIKAGDFVPVEITDAYDYDLKGVLIDDCGLKNADLKTEVRGLKPEI